MYRRWFSVTLCTEGKSMSFGIASAMAGPASQAQLAASSPIETPSEKNAASKVAELKQWANTEQPAAKAVKTERADAVQATPASSPAAVVAFNVEPVFDTDMPEYPIFGPDKFARTMAVRNAESVKEAEAAPKPQEDIESVAELAKIAEEVKANNGSKASDIEPPEKPWKLSAVPEPSDNADAGAEVVRLIDQNNNAAEPSGGGVAETTAEAGEADLTQ